MASPTSAPRPQPKKTQACDACRLRKVRCNGAVRCQQCSHLDLRCIYSAPKTRARSSTKRGALISRYKAESHGNGTPATNATSPFSGQDQLSPATDVSSNTWGSPNGTRNFRLPSLVDVVPLDSPTNAMSPTDGLPQDPEYFLSFIPEYETCVYPVNPVITPAEAREAIYDMPNSREACAFVYSLVAMTLMLAPQAPALQRPILASVPYWTDQTVASKVLPSSGITVRMIVTADFLHVAFMALQKPDLAFYYLREAITLGAMLRLDDPVTLRCVPLAEKCRRQRLYSELFIHERYYALSCYRPTVLPPLLELPDRDPETAEHVHEGWSQLIRLFLLIDEEFIQHWLDTRTGRSSSATLEWVENKHRQINEEPAGSDEMVAPLTVMQQADLIITKHWLRTLVWQLALSNCLVGSAESSLSLTFPLGLSSSLRDLISRMSRKDISVHGSGIQEKFFEITDTIANVILSTPNIMSPATPQSLRDVEDFVLVAKFVFSLNTFGTIQRQILNEKLYALQRQFPSVENATPAAEDLQWFSQWLDQTTFDELGVATGQ